MAQSDGVRWLHVSLIMSTALCIGLSIGLFPALLALTVEARGYNSSFNGLLAAMHDLAGLVVSPFVPRLMAAFGSKRTYLVAVAFAAFMAISFSLIQQISLWFALRFVLGLGLGVQWVVGETWMNQIAQGPRRGLIISIYLLVLSLGLAIGPLIMTVAGINGAAPFFATASLLALSCIPILFLPQTAVSAGADGKPLSIWASVKRKPSAMLAAALDGFIFQGFMAFLPLYFLRLGTPQETAISMLNAFFAGTFALQLLVGYLLDRMSPATVVFGSSLILLAGFSLTVFPSIGSGWLWLAIFLMGGPEVSIYTAGLASINDSFSAEEMPSGTAAFTMVWHIGGLLGPATAGFAMDLWNPYGFTAAMAAAVAVLALANISELFRARAKRNVIITTSQIPPSQP